MNFSKYTNTYCYPTKADFTSNYYYKEGKIVAISSMSNLHHHIPEIPLKDCIKEVVVDEVGFKAERKKYYDNGSQLLEQFKIDLADELGLTNHPKWDKLYSIAWEECHNDGYESVYHFASDLAELLY